MVLAGVTAWASDARTDPADAPVATASPHAAHARSVPPARAGASDADDAAVTRARARRIRVGIVPAAPRVAIGGAGALVVRDLAGGLDLDAGVGGTIDIAAGRVPTAERSGAATPILAAGAAEPLGWSALLVSVDGATHVVRGVLVVEASGGIVTVDGRRYRGRLEVRCGSAGTLSVVNELPVEDYLYGVVPREMSPRAWPAIEAQMAQAVAARTYALASLGKHAASGFDVLATVADQVYGGLDAEEPLSRQAVDRTAGVVATHGGRLIAALYSATAGGYTADAAEVFDATAFGGAAPYLRGVPEDAASPAAPTLAEIQHATGLRWLRRAWGGASDDDPSSHERWAVEWSNDEIGRVVAAWVGHPVGRVRALEVRERGPSGRVIRLAYVTDSGVFTDTRDHIRQSLRVPTARGQTASLPSTLFYVVPLLDPLGELDGFRVYGAGLGHGVGMSQRGAVRMAQRGARYDEILGHYYTGVALERR